MFYNLTSPKQILLVVILSELIPTENKLLNLIFLLLNYLLSKKKSLNKKRVTFVWIQCSWPGVLQ